MSYKWKNIMWVKNPIDVTNYKWWCIIRYGFTLLISLWQLFFYLNLIERLSLKIEMRVNIFLINVKDSGDRIKFNMYYFILILIILKFFAQTKGLFVILRSIYDHIMLNLSKVFFCFSSFIYSSFILNSCNVISFLYVFCK